MRSAAAELCIGAPPVANHRVKVLIAEDEPKLRERLIAQLHAQGISPRVTSTGYETLRAVDQFRPDLILLDGLLPEMHGFEIARFIRNMDRVYRPRIAIVTGIYKNVRYQNEARLKYGIDHYLVKPVDDVSLARLITLTTTETH
jgi:DNA-binding response OmpR family regulator